jgi:hypothetical protein
VGTGHLKTFPSDTSTWRYCCPYYCRGRVWSPSLLPHPSPQREFGALWSLEAQTEITWKDSDTKIPCEAWAAISPGFRPEWRGKFRQIISLSSGNGKDFPLVTKSIVGALEPDSSDFTTSLGILFLSPTLYWAESVCVGDLREHQLFSYGFLQNSLLGKFLSISQLILKNGPMGSI